MRRFFAALGVVLLVSSCGIPDQQSAEPLDNVPTDLLTTSTTATSLPPDEEFPYALVLFWHADQRLVRVERPIRTPPTVQQAVDQLVSGPTTEETEAETALSGALLQPDGLLNPALAPVVGPANAEGTVIITITPPPEFDSQARVNFAAELVCTVTEFPGISGVLIDDGGPVPVALSTVTGEAIVGRPANRTDYDCMPPLETITPTTTG